MFLRVLLILCFATLLPLVSHADEDWNPTPPKAEKWDWLQLTSGEWLKGEVIVLYNDAVEFDSDELDEVTIDLEDIKSLRTAQVLEVRFLGGIDRVGQITMIDDQLHFNGEEQGYSRHAILSATAGEAKESNYWVAKFSLGANIRQGNSDQVDITSSLKAKRRTVGNRLDFDYIANYSQLDNEETADNQRFNFSWDRFIRDRLFWRPIFLEYLHDPFQNINSKYTVGTGLGYDIVDNDRTEWNIVAGPAFQQTQFITVEEGKNDRENTGSFGLSSDYEYEITGDIDYFLNYSGNFVNSASGTYNHYLSTGLEIELTKMLDLDISLNWDHTKNPQADEDGITPKSDDLRLVVGIGIEY
ncbi:hypothetical protein SIN8267_01312 [Sinobacterium norvegicum]|uniref:DUF481 domain-containing protein n=1 Tax=Sinobacterium norvegicum TaxID=1641715 RepID=A0ABN8EHQ8_9GAMM|nr:DUF481 domain-containing protein [Sinobacterium norvegicum]CAH0991210.1 hypothetical protein SIN8267_01312 [Sinobacterium norvegicum]